MTHVVKMYWANKDGKKHPLMFPEDMEDAVIQAARAQGYVVSITERHYELGGSD